MRKNYRKWASYVGCIIGILVFGTVSIASARVAVITTVKGMVEVQKAGEPAWKPAAAKMELKINDKVQTKNGAMCELTLDDGSLIKLRENSTLEINDLSEDKEAKKKSSIFKLLLGKLWAKVEHQEGSKFNIVTPTAVAGVRGTEFAIIVQRDGASDILVFKGKIEVKSLREEIGEIRVVLVEEGKALGIKPGEFGLPRDLTPQEKGDWQKFIESKARIEIKLTEEERKEIRSEVAELRQELREHRLFGLEVKKSDFAAGRSMKDHNKVLVRVEQRIYRPSGDSIRFLNLNMRGTPSPQNLQYYQADWGFSGEIPSSLIGAIIAIAADKVTLTRAESLWANAAPGVVKRDYFLQKWNNTNLTDGYAEINDKEIKFDTTNAPSTTQSSTGEMNWKTTFNLQDGGNIKMESWVINNEGKVLTANDFAGKNPYDMLRKDVGFEIAWNLSGATLVGGGAIAMKNGGVIDIVFIPDIIFVMADAAMNELRNLASVGNLTFGQ